MPRIIVQTTASPTARRLHSVLALSGPEASSSARGRSEPGFSSWCSPLSYPERWYTEGLRVMTTTYPIKPAYYAVTKSTNYLPNVLMQMEAKEAGFDNGVFVDPAGHVGECSNMNVAFVTLDGAFKHPKFDHVLSGCTVLRLLELARGLRDEGLVTDVIVGDIPVAEAYTSREMLLIGSSVKVRDCPVGDRQIGMASRPGGTGAAPRLEKTASGDRLIDVPY